jgi:hypothetical protein
MHICSSSVLDSLKKLKQHLEGEELSSCIESWTDDQVQKYLLHRFNRRDGINEDVGPLVF